jgi:hypothetical protein
MTSTTSSKEDEPQARRNDPEAEIIRDKKQEKRPRPSLKQRANVTIIAMYTATRTPIVRPNARLWRTTKKRSPRPCEPRKLEARSKEAPPRYARNKHPSKHKHSWQRRAIRTKMEQTPIERLSRKATARTSPEEEPYEHRSMMRTTIEGKGWYYRQLPTHKMWQLQTHKISKTRNMSKNKGWYYR